MQRSRWRVVRTTWSIRAIMGSDFDIQTLPPNLDRIVPVVEASTPDRRALRWPHRVGPALAFEDDGPVLVRHRGLELADGLVRLHGQHLDLRGQRVAEVRRRQ